MDFTDDKLLACLAIVLFSLFANITVAAAFWPERIPTRGLRMFIVAFFAAAVRMDFREEWAYRRLRTQWLVISMTVIILMAGYALTAAMVNSRWAYNLLL